MRVGCESGRGSGRTVWVLTMEHTMQARMLRVEDIVRELWQRKRMDGQGELLWECGRRLIDCC